MPIKADSDIMSSLTDDYKTCAVCLQIFKEQTELEAHIELIHPNIKEEKIVLCDGDIDHYKETDKDCTMTASPELYTDQNHLDSHHLEFDHPDVKDANIIETSRGSDSSHDHENKDKIQCSICAEKYDNMTEYTHHLNMHSQDPSQPIVNKNKCREQPYKCPCDPATFDESRLMKEELECSKYKSLGYGLHINDNDVEACSICSMQFSHKAELKRHIDAIHYDPGHIKKGNCDTDTEFADKKTQVTIKTEATEHTLRPFPCTLCNKSFAWKGDRNKHVDAVHRKLKPFSCTFCDKSFTKKGNLNKHVDAVHHKIKQFTCSLCDTSFAEKKTLTRHIDVVHCKLKPFSCTLCDKSFTQKGMLTRHVDVVHHKLKSFPFSCTLCDKSFTQKRDLNRHVQTVHQKLKPFSCSLCSKSFAEKQTLTTHVNAIHHKLKLFSCTLCDKSFTQKGTLARHWFFGGGGET